MAKIWITSSHNPWFNLATEAWLIEQAGDEDILFLWRNQPCVVIGKYQNPWAECNLAAMKEHDILLARRYSGGGAVYHDLGNTCFTFISPKSSFQKAQNFSLVIAALRALGISAETSGRNDITVSVSGKKVSGSAFQLTKTHGCHHGTMLINAKLSAVSDYLTPNKEKLLAKGIRSVASRVSNLSEITPITHEQFCDALIQTFSSRYDTKPEIITIDSTFSQNSLNKHYKNLKSENWRFGQTPEFSHEFCTRLDWGIISILLIVTQGVITEANVYSDTLESGPIELLRELLPGLRYQAATISQAIAQTTYQTHVQTMAKEAILALFADSE